MVWALGCAALGAAVVVVSLFGLRGGEGGGGWLLWLGGLLLISGLSVAVGIWMRAPRRK